MEQHPLYRLYIELNDKKVLDIITDFLNDFSVLRSGKIYRYSGEFGGAHICELENR